MDNLLLGKNVLITGAGANIGKSIAIEMAKQGANILFAEIDEDRCAGLERELSEYPIMSKGFLTDVSNPVAIDCLYRSLVQDYVGIDVLVNNVGMQHYRTEGGHPLEEWHKMFDTNLFGPMYLTKLISETMINNSIHGSIIFITSIHQWAVRRMPSYSSSKAALGMIIKELALDLAPHNIRVNGVAPGWIKEDHVARTIRQKHTPLHESSINPCYIGRAVVYLASDYFSKFTTGTVIKIDAGLSLYNHIAEQITVKTNPLTLSERLKQGAKARLRSVLFQ
jgi:NAD(P)-dependent dehydrogenase (short-subunit alcohol dehydrogenase family)